MSLGPHKNSVPLHLSVLGIGWTLELTTPSLLSLHLSPCPRLLGPGLPSRPSALPPVERASSSGRWCVGLTPTVSGSVRGTSRTPFRSAACLPVQVSWIGWGVGRQARLPQLRPETQPGWHPGPLEIPNPRAASPRSQEISRTLQ